MLVQLLKKQITTQNFFYFFAIACFSYASYIAINYANQVPLDFYAFRQTQTALTAYWLMKNGFHLAYETPVGGPPWSIPFEFPIYQYIVAIITKFTGGNINTIARLISYLFLVLCLFPVRSITKSLHFPKAAFYLFIAFFLSSPIYLYWGRTFMIETAALFFSLVGIKYFVVLIQSDKSYKDQILFALFMSLGILQKATTTLPILILLFICYFLLEVNKNHHSLKLLCNKKMFFTLILCFGLPISIGTLWTVYTDHIKELNLFGGQLTSKSLHSWNWGDLHQRFSSTFYIDVLWKRIFQQNLSGIFGIGIVLIALGSKIDKVTKFTILVCLLLGLMPLFLFTNLHIVHYYYQTANIIFLIYAIALSTNYVLTEYCKNIALSLLIVTCMLISNYYYFSQDYLGTIKADFNTENSRDYAVASVLKKEIPENKYFIAFGNDWSSTLAYLSERKSFTVPEFFKYYNKIALHPEKYTKNSQLGAVVVCPSVQIPTVDYLSQWVSTQESWKIIEVQGCHIAYQSK
ncbi:hypothetical protein Lgra_0763 [Legionella gratiana]|uniref:Glycosyltransferase RgtA/B/C/D-like domain-containing protein n=1 Tax=Legionella gratiana TaxID=45066 RepID=A0A378JEG7_9GAMM|nr:hypothetical protein [Legionella gratiana]KTD14153.1 hypothetical protein Lgra_0763 [Legionella gratiana]STX46284.1 Uncharacterised protein [Legionella gratiana]